VSGVLNSWDTSIKRVSFALTEFVIVSLSSFIVSAICPNSSFDFTLNLKPEFPLLKLLMPLEIIFTGVRVFFKAKYKAVKKTIKNIRLEIKAVVLLKIAGELKKTKKIKMKTITADAVRIKIILLNIEDLTFFKIRGITILVFQRALFPALSVYF
jgi:hypothetical protein